MTAVVATASCQTQYRESEAQTHPWTPPYLYLSAKTPEILTLTSLTWGHGLPAGKHEIAMVEKLRKRRFWDKYIGSIFSPQTVQLRTKILTDLEMDSGQFREQELEDINNERMELAGNILVEQKNYFANRMLAKIKMRKAFARAEVNEKLKKIKINHDKQLRRINAKEIEFRNKFEDRKLQSKPILDYEKKAGSVVLCSEARTPLRFDAAKPPSRIYLVQRRSVKNLTRRHDCLNTQPIHWHEDELKKQKRNLKKLFGLDKYTSHPAIDNVEEEEECDNIKRTHDDKLYLAAVLIQQTMKGRAIQVVMEENRKKHQGLIDEMLYSISLIPNDIKKKNDEKMAIMKAFRTYCKQKEKLERIIGTLVELEGQTLGRLIDFTAKELVRISEGEKLAAICLLGQAERWEREATESGRRSKEKMRERQIKEIYRQIVQQVDQDLTDPMRLTLKNAMLETGVLVAEDELRKLICNIDEDSKRNLDILEREEMISKLTNHVLLPDLDKEEARQSLLQEQEVQRKMVEKDDSLEESPELVHLSVEEIRTKAEELCDQMICTAQDLYSLAVSSSAQHSQMDIINRLSTYLGSNYPDTEIIKAKKYELPKMYRKDDPMSKVVYDKSLIDLCESCYLDEESEASSISLQFPPTKEGKPQCY